MRLKDKIGIVTAAGSGMGRAGALRFARKGQRSPSSTSTRRASTAVVERDEDERRQGAAASLADLRAGCRGPPIVRETASPFGGLDFVWNHLGHPGPAAVEGIDMAGLRARRRPQPALAVVTTEAALPELRARGGGSLLFTASTSGRRARVQPGLLGGASSAWSASSARWPSASARG